MIPVTEHPEPGLTQKGIPPPVVAHRFRMLTAIELHHQVCLEAGKIHDIGTDRMLTAKPAAFQLSPSEMSPEMAFSISCLTAKLPGTTCDWVHGDRP